MIDPPAQANYLAMGLWLKKNGESIYATTGGPYKPGPYGVCTRKNNRIFIHVLASFAENSPAVLQLPAFDAEILKAHTIDGEPVTVEREDNAPCIMLNLSKVKPNKIDTIVVLELKKSAADIAPIETANRVAVKKAEASSSYGKNMTPDCLVSGGKGAFEAGIHRRGAWVAKGNPQREQWLTIEFEKPESINALTIAEPRGRHLITDFAIEYDDNGTWHKLGGGKEIGNGFSLIFRPVKTSKLRLRIIAYKEGDPGIQRFEAFRASCN
jgi:alpha-L-fucosidase